MIASYQTWLAFGKREEIEQDRIKTNVRKLSLTNFGNQSETRQRFAKSQIVPSVTTPTSITRTERFTFWIALTCFTSAVSNPSRDLTSETTFAVPCVDTPNTRKSLYRDFEL